MSVERAESGVSLQMQGTWSGSTRADIQTCLGCYLKVSRQAPLGLSPLCYRSFGPCERSVRSARLT